MLNEIETFFLVAKPELSFLSSSAAKTIAKFGGDITGFIPEAIEKETVLNALGNFKGSKFQYAHILAKSVGNVVTENSKENSG